MREGYASIAKGDLKKTSCGGSGCCGSTPVDRSTLTRIIGYSEEEASAIPDANLGLSCGNPTPIASLTPREIVLDLGSGGGFDVFIAGPKVGPSGRVIGVDMTPEMVSMARQKAHSYRLQSGLDNVEFRLGEIEHLPVADASVDVVISNCVLSLSPDKPQAWREIARVLKPGGRVAVSDLALLQPLPSSVREMVEALIGCVAGAVLAEESERMIRDAGLTDIKLTPKSDYIKAMADWEDPLYCTIADALPVGSTASDFITSLNVTARKPG